MSQGHLWFKQATQAHKHWKQGLLGVTKVTDYTGTQVPSILGLPHSLGPQNPMHSADGWRKAAHLNHFDLSYISFFITLGTTSHAAPPSLAMQMSGKYNPWPHSYWPVTRIQKTKHKYVVDSGQPQLTFPVLLSPTRLTFPFCQEINEHISANSTSPGRLPPQLCLLHTVSSNLYISSHQYS